MIRNVFVHTVVVVAGHVAGGAILDLTLAMTERVPRRRSRAVCKRRAFDLVRRACRAPYEAPGKLMRSMAAESTCTAPRRRGLAERAV